MISKNHAYLIKLLLFVNLLTLWIFLFREYYIVYHHIKIYYLVSGTIAVLIMIFATLFKKYIKLAGLVSLVGISLYLALPLSFWPKITSNPDVIKMLQLTMLILNKKFQLAKTAYVAFPGFSYIVGIVGTVTGMPLQIKISALLYMFLSIIFAVGIFTFGRYPRWTTGFLVILLSSGFVYSFNYFSPQLIAQILYVLFLVTLLSTNVSNKTHFLVLVILYSAIILLHPQTTLMTLMAFLLYFGFHSFINQQSKNISWTKLILPIILLTFYMLFFASSFGSGTGILKKSIMYLRNIDIIISKFVVSIKDIIFPEARVVTTSATLKPGLIKTLYKINIFYNGALLYGILLVSTFLTSGILVIITGFGLKSSLSGVILRPAIGASFVISVLISDYLMEKRSNYHMNVFIFTGLCLLIILFVTFPSRVPPQESDVHEENYYPPLNFIGGHGGDEIMDTYYFLYPSLKSIDESKYMVLPIGQDTYVSGMSNWVKYNPKSVMDEILKRHEYNAIIYDNSLAKILWRGGKQ